MAEHYYRLAIDSERERTTEIFLKSKGKIERANYFYYSVGCFPQTKAKGTLTLTEITKKEYDKFSKISVR